MTVLLLQIIQQLFEGQNGSRVQMMGVKKLKDQDPQVFVFTNSSDLLVKEICRGKEKFALYMHDGNFWLGPFGVLGKLRQLAVFVVPMFDHFRFRDFFEEQKNGGDDTHKNCHLQGK